MMFARVPLRSIAGYLNRLAVVQSPLCPVIAGLGKVAMRIQIEFQGPGFVAVPNHVVDMIGGRLSCEAFAALVALAKLPVGSEWSVSGICAKLGFSRRSWERASRDLRAVGALFDAEGDVCRGADGKIRGRVLAVRWPDEAKPRRVVSGPKRTVTDMSETCKGLRSKPTCRKRVVRCAEVIEVLDKNDVSARVPAASLNKHKGEAAAPTGGKAASPAPSTQSEAMRAGVFLLPDAVMSDYRRCARPGETRQAWLLRCHGGVVPSAVSQSAENGQGV